MELQLGYFKPKRYEKPKKYKRYESAALNMPANFENSAVATELKKVSFHSKPKERQCQRVIKLPDIAFIYLFTC